MTRLTDGAGRRSNNPATFAGSLRLHKAATRGSTTDSLVMLYMSIFVDNICNLSGC
jgi:hypothetical protein